MTDSEQLTREIACIELYEEIVQLTMRGGKMYKTDAVNPETGSATS